MCFFVFFILCNPDGTLDVPNETLNNVSESVEVIERLPSCVFPFQKDMYVYVIIWPVYCETLFKVFFIQGEPGPMGLPGFEGLPGSKVSLIHVLCSSPSVVCM